MKYTLFIVKIYILINKSNNIYIINDYILIFNNICYH